MRGNPFRLRYAGEAHVVLRDGVDLLGERRDLGVLPVDDPLILRLLLLDRLFDKLFCCFRFVAELGNLRQLVFGFRHRKLFIRLLVFEIFGMFGNGLLEIFARGNQLFQRFPFLAIADIWSEARRWVTAAMKSSICRSARIVRASPMMRSQS